MVAALGLAGAEHLLIRQGQQPLVRGRRTMLKRVAGYLLMISLLVLVSTTPALSSTYFIYEQYGGTWHDANKVISDESQMCWGAAASNILSWGNWGVSGYKTEASIFQYLADHWTNKAGYPVWAWNWWFSGAKPPVNVYAYPNAVGGDFFPSLKLKNYYGYAASGNLLSIADTLMHKGDGVALTIRNSSGGAHAVTLWGYSTNSSGVYSSIYITDSDDGVTALQNYTVTWLNNAWYLNGRYNGWKISDVEALGFYASPGSLPMNGQPAAGESPVPIAPSWLLFGTGLLPFVIKRRRRPGKTRAASSC
jgi:hypothetical protein